MCVIIYLSSHSIYSKIQNKSVHEGNKPYNCSICELRKGMKPNKKSICDYSCSHLQKTYFLQKIKEKLHYTNLKSMTSMSKTDPHKFTQVKSLLNVAFVTKHLQSLIISRYISGFTQVQSLMNVAIVTKSLHDYRVSRSMKGLILVKSLINVTLVTKKFTIKQCR